MDRSRYYRPSGAAPLGTVLSSTQFGVFAAVVCGALYGVISYYNPIIYINFIGVGVLAYLTATALKSRFESGRLRNRAVKILAAAVCGMIAVYCAWWVWLSALSEWEMIALNPIELPGILEFIAAQGVWEIDNTRPTGWALYIIWGFEAAMIVVATVAITISEEVPFCETCEEWTELSTNAIPIPLQQREVLREWLETEQYDTVVNLIGSEFDPSHCMLLKFHKCPECDESCYLTVNESKFNHKNDSETVTARITYIHVPQSVLDDVNDRIESLAGGDDAATDAAPLSDSEELA